MLRAFAGASCGGVPALCLQVSAGAFQPAAGGGEPAQVQHHEIQGSHTQTHTQHQQHCKSTHLLRFFILFFLVSSFFCFEAASLSLQTALERRKNSYSKPSGSSPLTGVLSAKQGERHNLFALNQQRVKNTFCRACLQHTDPHSLLLILKF